MISSILVPLDGSTFGEHALPLAINIAKRTKAALHLSHVHKPLEATYAEIQLFDDTLDQQIRGQEEAYLKNIGKRIQDTAKVTVHLHHESGEVASVVRSQAPKVGANLIVMTTHARGAFGRLWLGSNTDELLRDSPVPLLLLHPKDHAPDLTEDVALKHILIPLDGTPLAEQIIPHALELGRVFEADYTLLRIIRPIAPMPVPVGLGTFETVAQDMAVRVEQIETRIEEEAAEYLGKVGARLREEKLNVKAIVAMDEQPGVGVLHHAKEPIDALALGSHGRRGLSRLFVGSVADKVIRGSPLPVLVHRPKEK